MTYFKLGRFPAFSLAAASLSLLSLSALFACSESTIESNDVDESGDKGSDADDGSAGGSSSGSGSNTGNSGGSIGTSSGGLSGSGSGGTAAIDRACSTNFECTVASATCCGTCGAPSKEDSIGITRGQESAHRDSLCGGDAICPACAAQLNPNLFASCISGQCEAVDLTEDDASTCKMDAECTLRPAACCECGAGNSYWDVVAINSSKSTDFEESQCTDALVACTECVWAPPSDLLATCDQGRCKITGDGVPAP